MDKQSQDNRADQMNPNHESSGPGHESGYHGSGTTADLDNHANQMNSNNDAHSSSKGGESSGKSGDIKK